MFYRITLVMALSAGDILMFLAGTSLTWSSSQLPKLSHPSTTPFARPLTSSQASWVSSLLTLGAALGPFLFCFLADRVGRKNTLLMAGVPFTACYLMMAFATSVETFYAARLVMGLTVGGVCTLMPIYVGEISDKTNRGFLGSLMACATCMGLLFSNALGPFVSVQIFNLIPAFLALVFLLLFTLFGEEVPHYYVSINEDLLAKEALHKLRGGIQDVEEELIEIQDKFKEEARGSFADIFASRGLKKAFFTSVMLLLFQQFCGINVVLFYSQRIFEDSGASWSPEICSIVLGVVQFLTSFIAPIALGEFGRTTLLCFSGIGMALSEASLAAYSYLQSRPDFQMASYLSAFPMVAMVLFITVYNTGYGPLPWLMLGELFPTRVKSLATSCTCFLSWMLTFIITKHLMMVLDCVGLSGYFAISAGFSLAAGLFGKFYCIETRGKSLPQIQKELDM
ncbi:unnamed protein product [Phaedon cochleariae]|uniref:Major facilitator superfamily (MFS) profile domain-containing protein n=1 Tax=Phaedon cochleariae TaxID=80249 RepID=A0A9P0DSS2_PHACE|nr:unnamed protein product [Phaedon cochleariae]